MNELDFYNPYDDEDDLILIEEEKPKKRRRKRNPEPIAIATPILLLLAGYLGWCAYSSRYATWSWQPWKKLAGKSRLQLRRTNPQTEAEKQRQAAYDVAVEKMMAPAPSVEEIDVWRPPKHDALEKEVVSFITP